MDDRDYDSKDVNFSVLAGKTIKQIVGLEAGSERAKFYCTDGTEFWMSYYNDCCASCSIEDIAGDISDILNSEILLAEEVSSSKPNEKTLEERKARYKAEKNPYYETFESWLESCYESETWTFYKLSTIKGSITIRWYGSSNGYYSERSTFEQITKETK